MGFLAGVSATWNRVYCMCNVISTKYLVICSRTNHCFSYLRFVLNHYLIYCQSKKPKQKDISSQISRHPLREQRNISRDIPSVVLRTKLLLTRYLVSQIGWQDISWEVTEKIFAWYFVFKKKRNSRDISSASSRTETPHEISRCALLEKRKLCDISSPALGKWYFSRDISWTTLETEIF